MIYSITIATLFISVASIGLSFIDYTKIINDVIIQKIEKVKRGAAVLLLNTGIGVILHINYDTSIVFASLYLQTIYWIAFDLSLNLFRGKSVLYTSNNKRNDNDSIFDKVFNFLPNPYSGLLQFVVKVSFVVIFATLL